MKSETGIERENWRPAVSNRRHADHHATDELLIRGKTRQTL